MVSIENVLGSYHDDIIISSHENNIIDARDGVDTVSYAEALNAVNVDLNAGTATGDGNDTFIDVENIIGSDFDDTIIGKARC